MLVWPGFGGGGEGDPQEGRLLQTSLTKAERFMTPPLAHPGPQAPLSLNMRMGDLDRAGAVSAAVLWARGAVVWASHPLQPCEENPRHSGAPRTPDLLLASQRTGSAEAKPPCNAGDTGSIPGSGRSPGGGHSKPLQYSCLENPIDRGALWATVHGVTKS